MTEFDPEAVIRSRQSQRLRMTTSGVLLLLIHHTWQRNAPP